MNSTFKFEDGLVIAKNTRFIFRNFSGKRDAYNREGDCNFGVILSEDAAERLEREGWNVRRTRPRDEDDEPTPYLKVRVNYGRRSPKIYLVANRKKTLLNEDTVGELDTADIRKVDVVITPYHYDVNGKQGISAYVLEMVVTIRDDILSSEYDFDDPVDENGHLPF